MPAVLVQETLRPYTAREASRLLDLSVRQIRGWVKDGLLTCPPEGDDLHLSFEDLVLLRAAKALIEAEIKPKRVRATLRRVKTDLPADVSLSSLRFDAEEGRIVVGDGTCRWNADSGQTLFDFDAEPNECADEPDSEAPAVTEPDRAVAHLWETPAPEALHQADDWFGRGLELEGDQPEEARYAYRQALALDESHFEAHINLGRLLHEIGDLRGAERHYRRAGDLEPDDATAVFNLGVVLEDLGLGAEALEAYEQAFEADPGFADPVHNAVRLYESRGDKASAVGLLKRLRELRS